jgi:DNA-binding IclR family transcriptional regulator
MGNVSHLVTRTAAFQSSVENGLAEEGSGKDRQFVTALARGLDILRAFHAGEGMLGNQEIAHRTGLPKPTVARLTHTLTELGYLNYIRRFRKYELGASVLALGYAAISSMDVRRASRQPLEQLAHALNASTALGGRDRHSMIYLEACRGPSVVAITHDVGTRVPMASTAMGRDRLEADWGPRLVKVARDIRTGMAAQPSAAPAPTAVRPVTNGQQRPPMSAMARR